MPPSGVWSSVAACFSIWLVFTIYKRYNHIRNLRFLPGPPTVSYLWGDTIDLRQSPVGTKYREWRRKYGTTYIIREPLMVRSRREPSSHLELTFCEGTHTSSGRHQGSCTRIEQYIDLLETGRG